MNVWAWGFFTFILGFSACLTATDLVSKCPCHTKDLCLPINDTTRKEVFAFSLSQDILHWLLYDWQKLTTLVQVGYLNTTLMCLAHTYNARISYIANVNKVNFTDPSSRQSWIAEQTNIVQMYYLDGLNFDFEGVIDENDQALRDGYTNLVAETKSALSKISPYYQILTANGRERKRRKLHVDFMTFLEQPVVTVDVPWKQNVDIRYFDFNGLAAHSDFLFVMAYDEQSQIFGECIAGPNSGFNRTFTGIEDYLSYGIEPEKLVLGVPWYGYNYPCIRQEKDTCFIQHVPFRGVNCSDAAGKQINYGDIYALLKSHGTSGSWNSSSQTPFFSYQDSNQKFHQIQFDNPKSLTLKYNQANKYNLRGVGMWNIDALDYSVTPEGELIRDSMFFALPNYKKF